MKWLTGLAAGLALSAGTVHAADKWDMPTAYVDSNYHTQNGKLFAEAVGVCTGGDLEIVVHGGGTLFKGGEIKRAVQTGRAPIGERLLSAHQNPRMPSSGSTRCRSSPRPSRHPIGFGRRRGAG